MGLLVISYKNRRKSPSKYTSKAKLPIDLSKDEEKKAKAAAILEKWERKEAKRVARLEAESLAHQRRVDKTIKRVNKPKPKEGTILVWKNWKKYSSLCRWLTLQQDLSLVNNIKLRDFNTYHLDHIVSIWDGYRHQIQPEIIAHISNLQVITAEENKRKGKYSPPEALAKMLASIHS